MTEVAVVPKKCGLLPREERLCFPLGNNSAYCAEARSFCVRAFEVNEPTDRSMSLLDFRW